MALTILKAIKKPVSIKNMIHSRLAGWEKARSNVNLHASDLMKDLEFCPREVALLDMGLGKKKDSYIGTSLRITFDHGRDIEHRIRNDWLRDAVVGTWKCGVCGTDHPVFGKAPKSSCGKCGYSHQWEYSEPRFLSPKSGVSGGVDALIDVGESKLRILEIKTMDKDEFKKLLAPLAEHKFRTSLYLRLAEEADASISERVNTKEANILYITKSYGFKDESLSLNGIKDSPFSPFKEFVITRDDSIHTTPLAKAEVVTVWRNNGMKPEHMPAGICTNGLSGRAQKCSCNASCFSGQAPHSITWMENGVKRHPDKELVK